MIRILPRAEDLNQEEIDYELLIRNQEQDVFALDLAGKQRHLRSLFKEDLKEGRSYQSPLSITAEIEHIQGRIDTLEKALEKKVELKYESRVLHYWYRAKWSKAFGEEEKRMRRELCQRIEAIMKHYQFGPPQNPIVGQINTILSGTEGAVGGHRSRSETSDQGSEKNKASPTADNEKHTGTKPKEPMEKFDNPSEVTISRTEWLEMK